MTLLNYVPMIRSMQSLGKKIYVDQCANYHGVAPEGQAGWRDKMVDDMRLVPPHDKSGHTWHHPDALLFKLTKYGFAAMIGNDYKVSMPICDDVLKAEQRHGKQQKRLLISQIFANASARSLDF